MVAVYVDVLLAVNFAVDYLMIKAASIFCGVSLHRARILLAAVIGAAFRAKILLAIHLEKS